MDRKQFLLALVEEAHRSGTINPHFYKLDFMKRHGLDEGAFNLAQSSLGDKYCRMVGAFEAQVRYAIDLPACLEMKERIEGEALADAREARAEARAWQSSWWWQLLLVIAGGVLGAMLAKVAQ